MTLRLTSALCILFLAGCTSSEPQNISHVPAIEETATMPSPLPPVAYDPAIPEGDTAAAASLQAGHNCHRTGNAILCDAPADPNADTTSYTN